jgi:hypothetical protein
MGLDSYWSLKNSDKNHPKFSPPLNLCGGLFSGHGAESFRGKVYSPFFEEELGLTLYQEEISAENIKEISLKLEAYIQLNTENDNAFRTKAWSIYLENNEIKDLSRMFQTYASLDASLIGWW